MDQRPESIPPCVLIVEDYPDITIMMAYGLAMNGVLTRSAVQGLEGMTQAVDHRPDVIVTGIQMPGMSGWQYLAALRADERTRDIPVLVCSAMVGGPENRTRAFDAGAKAVVAKPCRPDDFDEAVLSLLAPGRRGVVANPADPRGAPDWDEIAARIGALAHAADVLSDATGDPDDAYEQVHEIMMTANREIAALRRAWAGFEVVSKTQFCYREWMYEALVQRAPLVLRHLGEALRGPDWEFPPPDQRAEQQQPESLDATGGPRRVGRSGVVET